MYRSAAREPWVVDKAGTEQLSEAEEAAGRDRVDFALLFEESPDILLVLLPDSPRFTTVAATHARRRPPHLTQESIGRGLFDLFPDNPNDPAATGSSNLRASLE